MNKINILIPIYNDWQSVLKLLENINSEISTLEGDFSVTIVTMHLLKVDQNFQLI